MNVFWKDPEKTILIREYDEKASWEEYRDSIWRMRQMILEVKHNVSVIIDARMLEGIPQGALGYFNDGNRNMPPNVAMRLLVTKNKFAYTLFTILKRISSENFQNYHLVGSMEAAEEKIAQFQKTTSGS